MKKASSAKHKQKRTDSAELTDDELLQADNDIAQNKEFLKEFDNALSNTGDTLIQDETAAEEGNHLVSNDEKPEIKMDSEEPIKSTRMRKKLVQESVVEAKNDVTSGMQFIGADVQGIETPSIDDLFADPSVNENNYQDMLFEATEEVMPDADATAIGMQTIKDEKPEMAAEEEAPEQVSDDLEPIKNEENPVSEPLAELAETSTEESTEEPAEEPTESPEEIADELPTEDHAEESAESAEERTELVEEHMEQAEDTFIPGSEHFDNSGLQFASRPHLEKSVHLLPEELTPIESKDGIELTVESPNVKAPINNNGLIELYNSHIYKDGKPLPWDIRFEVQLKEDEELTVDTGVGIKLPNGFGIKIIPVENIESKFGLKVISSLDVSRLEAHYSLKFVIRSVGLSSYIAKNQPLIRLKIFRI